ncbi:uncharacterized protein Nmag_1629 [Natrialba magadii ATCC 43099]|uniref:Uncharacterized protein n=1 Tax=Natrialba magadii (strain ATCC 43099 / DSM 3394 / CCM 3739 / CIP 104546 / IAM 13178 / JCM 8861 / NBRC 102185 / NCIMB 2190 / MS3) TaxID=547559 RepID=D3SUE7_NATMM|nr:hypothetical protein [Natrialba magadii]ADD05205.1 uncharacterized protein Nmag_1629 [Natrialba magadii ATCC 43099]ELY23241.1 hypothetical protein C500_20666 [Natrialba magadii ATCC 43099]
MTQLYDRLRTAPQTDVDLSNLNFEERQEARQISVTRTSDTTNIGPSGDFTTVYYLAGDEKPAAALFVDENRSELDAVAFSKKNIVQTNVPRPVYDWILHSLGERELEKHESVVLEERPDGPHWVIDRQRYDESPNRRYTTTEQRAARIDGCSIDELYEAFDEEIRESDLREHAAVMGNVRYILEYFRTADRFECVPVSADGEMAVRKAA